MKRAHGKTEPRHSDAALGPDGPRRVPKKKRSGKYPKRRGDAFERELADYLSTALGLDVRRMPLSGGGSTFAGHGQADLTGTPHLHVEAKRTNRFKPYDALLQAERSIRGTRSRDFPVALTRRDFCGTGDGLAVLRIRHFVELYRAYLHVLGHKHLPRLGGEGEGDGKAEGTLLDAPDDSANNADDRDDPIAIHAPH